MLRSPAILEREGIAVSVSEEDINDRSKADSLTRIVALCQLGWLVVQCIARAVGGLAITELELMTMAFVFCAVVIYGFWWHKPFDVERSCLVACPESEYNNVRKLLQPLPSQMKVFEGYKVTGDFDNTCTATKFQSSRTSDPLIEDILRMMFVTGDAHLSNWSAVLMYLTGTIFSAIHLPAWHWVFPSLLVQKAWRIFAAMAVGASLLPMLPELP